MVAALRWIAFSHRIGRCIACIGDITVVTHAE